MNNDISIEQIEYGSAFEFFKLGIALKNKDSGVTQAHIDTLTTYLNAREEMSGRVLFSLHQGKVLYLPLLEGPPLYAALYAFAQSLKCPPYAESSQALLKEWIDGDDRAVAYTMICLKWEADTRAAPSVLPSEDSGYLPQFKTPLTSKRFPELEAMSELAETLLSDTSEERAPALDFFKKVADVDGTRLNEVLPSITDALAGEDRDQLLKILACAIPNGLDVTPIVPVLSGLLLDRDYYESETIENLYNCLLAAVIAGVDIKMAWPFLPICLENGIHKLRLIKEGAKRGLSLSSLSDILLSYLEIPLPIRHDPTDPPLISEDLERAALALDTLAFGVERGDFSADKIDGRR